MYTPQYCMICLVDSYFEYHDASPTLSMWGEQQLSALLYRSRTNTRRHVCLLWPFSEGIQWYKPRWVSPHWCKLWLNQNLKVKSKYHSANIKHWWKASTLKENWPMEDPWYNWYKPGWQLACLSCGPIWVWDCNCSRASKTAASLVVSIRISGGRGNSSNCR